MGNISYDGYVKAPTINQEMEQMKVDLKSLKNRVLELNEINGNTLKGPNPNKKLGIGKKRDQILQQVELLYKSAIDEKQFIPTNPSPLNGTLARLLELQGELRELNKKY